MLILLQISSKFSKTLKWVLSENNFIFASSSPLLDELWSRQQQTENEDFYMTFSAFWLK